MSEPLGDTERAIECLLPLPDVEMKAASFDIDRDQPIENSQTETTNDNPDFSCKNPVISSSTLANNMKRNHAAAALIGHPIFYPGHMFSLDQSCLVFQIEFDRDIETFLRDFHDNLRNVDSVMRSLAPQQDPIELFNFEERRVDHFLFWVRCVLMNHNHPLLDLPKVTQTKGKDSHSWVVIFPCLDATPAMAAIQIGIEALNIAHAPSGTEESIKSKISNLISEASSRLKYQGLIGFNTLHFLKEAHHLGIPWFRFSRSIFQLGHGANSRLLNSSITDATSNLAVMIAKNKQQTSDILRMAGLPVPLQAPAKSADEAVAIGKKIGYPIVVKPADLEGGVGVSALLLDDASVRSAYAHAAERSKNILIEKHVEGNDYRLLLVNGEVLGVLERIPGGVTGNGRLSVRELVDLENHERATAQDDRRFLHPILADQEAERMLLHAKMNWDDVPAAGTYVRLRAAANVATGGVPKEMPVGEIHPDNLVLAQRAARTLRLNVAGIDLLIPDIRKSWLESGAGICEVNAQPQMFTTMHGPMLRSIMPKGLGRIPTMVVLTMSADCCFSKALYQTVLGLYPNAGFVFGKAASLGGRVITHRSPKIFDAARSLLIDTSMDAIVISASEDDVLSTGWPVDRCDVLLVIGEPGAKNPATSIHEMQKLVRAAKSLRPALVLIDGDDHTCQTATSQVEWLAGDTAESSIVRISASRQKLLEQVVSALRGS